MNDKPEAGDSIVVGPPGRHCLAALKREDDQAPGWIEDLPSALGAAGAAARARVRRLAERREASWRRLRRLIIPCITLSLACSPTPLTPVNPGGLSACPAACARLADLQCPWAGPTPSGATCVDRCEATERTQYATGHPQCVAVARDCDEADRVSAEGCTE
jgi:hypothetical protein